MKLAGVVLCLAALGAAGMLFAAADAPPWPVLEGPYLGQKPPGGEPRLFAPGLVSTGMYTRDIAMTPDGGEIYWTAAVGSWTYVTILMSRHEEGRWTPPEVVPFATDPRYRFIEPCVSPDGKRLFFASDRPSQPGGKEGNFDLWVADRTGNGWCEPKALGAPVNTEAGEFFPSVTKDGTLYFTRDSGPESAGIWRSRPVDGHFAAPERLPAQVNAGASQFNAFIAPDESYIILSVQGRKENLGPMDYCIAFRSPQDAWSPIVDLGPVFNGPKIGGYSPFVSRDGKYFFFMSARRDPGLLAPGEKLTYSRLLELHRRPGNGIAGIWWVDASFLEGLRPRPTPPDRTGPAPE